jgi:uncharacterized membrane protein
MEPVKNVSKSGDFQLSSENLYGKDRFKFGLLAEKAARFLGTPQYIFAQTLVIIVWIMWNLTGWNNFDHYPFEFLVLAVSLQAAYAAPLILLAQTRQDVREDRREAAEIDHREKLDLALAERTGEIHQLLKEVHHVTMELDEFIQEVHDYNVREDKWRGQNDSDYR